MRAFGTYVAYHFGGKLRGREVSDEITFKVLVLRSLGQDVASELGALKQNGFNIGEVGCMFRPAHLYFIALFCRERNKKEGNDVCTWRLVHTKDLGGACVATQGGTISFHFNFHCNFNPDGGECEERHGHAACPRKCTSEGASLQF